jgi:exodeoxyribonuclease-5
MAAHNQLRVSDLSPDQLEAYNAIRTWMNRGASTKPTLSLGGFAGAGKSALVSVLAHEMPSPLAFCAFTGKASSVLARKLAASGIPTISRCVRVDPETGTRPFEPRAYCGTIHGLVFRPCEKCMEEPDLPAHNMGLRCREPDASRTPGDFVSDDTCFACDPPPPEKKVKGPCPKCNDARYIRRETLDRPYRLIVIDEASMVSDEMRDVLLSFGVPILAVGDHGQLPPVKGAGSLMLTPDLRLEKIHRQAAGNPIIALSARIRETGDIDDGLEDGKAFTILSRRHLETWVGERFTAARLQADPRSPEGVMGSVLVSYTNKTRVALNDGVREALGLNGNPKDGEALICLANKAPIYNGMRGVVVGDTLRAGDGGGKAPKWKATVDFVEDGQKAKDILISEHQFGAEKTIDYDMARQIGVSLSMLGERYDFGYAMTCHKMQGSSAHEVGVVLEGALYYRSREERARWLYTSATRAEKKLVIIRG